MIRVSYNDENGETGVDVMQCGTIEDALYFLKNVKVFENGETCCFVYDPENEVCWCYDVATGETEDVSDFTEW